MADNTEPKSAWPEVVGKTPEEAKDIILKERSQLEVQIMQENQPATMDFRPDRVRIVVAKDTGLVKFPPFTG